MSSETEILAAFQNLGATQEQMLFEEYRYIYYLVSEKAPCAFLVFGTGRDSALWAATNKNGRTVFLEHDQRWITPADPSLKVYKVAYSTRRSEAADLLNRFRQGDRLGLEMKLPEEVLATRWDIILVDAPPGTDDDSPGRMQSIYAAYQLSRNHTGTDIFIHDTNRQVEKMYGDFFFGPTIAASFPRLSHYRK